MKVGDKVSTKYGDGVIQKIFQSTGLAKVKVNNSPITDFKLSELIKR